MRIGILFLLGLVFGLQNTPAFGQKRRGKQPPPPPVQIAEKLVCRLATGEGFGKIPIYRASFYRPGKLIYEGRKHTPKKGRYTYVLPDVFIKNLLLDAKAVKIMAAPVPPAGPPDAPTDTLYLWLEGKERTFVFSPVNGNEVVTKFAKKIREDVAAVLEEQEPAETPTDSAKHKNR